MYAYVCVPAHVWICGDMHTHVYICMCAHMHVSVDVSVYYRHVSSLVWKSDNNFGSGHQFHCGLQVISFM